MGEDQAATAVAANTNTAAAGPLAATTEAATISADKPVKDDDTVPEDSETAPTNTLAAAKNTKNVAANAKKMLNLRFLFANRDGLSVSIQCDPADTVGEVKGALISMWPKGTWTLFSFLHD
jgi:hypothetical protein